MESELSVPEDGDLPIIVTSCQELAAGGDTLGEDGHMQSLQGLKYLSLREKVDQEGLGSLGPPPTDSGLPPFQPVSARITGIGPYRVTSGRE